MAYQITLKKQAIKALEKINEPFYSSIKEAIYSLAENPRPIGYKKLKGRDGYRVRVADYRIIYTIHKDVLLVDVIAIGHRKEIYE
ncbi:MAG: type II toxin-antitoxin system RelE/ParE family toxin [Bacteroidetes bacterium]|nr:type II toxin-antitoxin system RelE/ParE family toxin [Bacteroidota bacterium]